MFTIYVKYGKIRGRLGIVVCFLAAFCMCGCNTRLSAISRMQSMELPTETKSTPPSFFSSFNLFSGFRSLSGRKLLMGGLMIFSYLCGGGTGELLDVGMDNLVQREVLLEVKKTSDPGDGKRRLGGGSTKSYVSILGTSSTENQANTAGYFIDSKEREVLYIMGTSFSPLFSTSYSNDMLLLTFFEDELLGSCIIGNSRENFGYALAQLGAENGGIKTFLLGATEGLNGTLRMFLSGINPDTGGISEGFPKNLTLNRTAWQDKSAVGFDMVALSDTVNIVGTINNWASTMQLNSDAVFTNASSSVINTGLGVLNRVASSSNGAVLAATGELTESAEDSSILVDLLKNGIIIDEKIIRSGMGGLNAGFSIDQTFDGVNKRIMVIAGTVDSFGEGQTDCVLMRLDGNATHINQMAWSITMGGTEGDGCNDAIIDSDRILATGFTLDPGNNPLIRSLLLFQVDMDGNLEKVSVFSGDEREWIGRAFAKNRTMTNGSPSFPLIIGDTIAFDDQHKEIIVIQLTDGGGLCKGVYSQSTKHLTFNALPVINNGIGFNENGFYFGGEITNVTDIVDELGFQQQTDFQLDVDEMEEFLLPCKNVKKDENIFLKSYPTEVLILTGLLVLVCCVGVCFWWVGREIETGTTDDKQVVLEEESMESRDFVDITGNNEDMINLSEMRARNKKNYNE